MYIHSIGFGLATSWLWLFYLQGPLLTPVADLWMKDSGELFSWFIGASCLMFLLLSMGFRLRSMLDKRLALAVSAMLLALCPILSALIPYVAIGTILANPLVVDFLAFLSGVSFACLITAWMQTFLLYDLPKLGLYFSAAIVMASSLTMLADNLNRWFILDVLTVMPPVSVFLLLLRSNRPTTTIVAKTPAVDIVNPFSGKFILLIVLFYNVGGTVFSIVNIERPFSAMFCLSNMSYFAVSLTAGIVLYRYPNLDLRFIYRPIAPLLASGFLLFSFHQHQLAMISFVLIQAGLALFDMYTWLLFPYFARFSTRPAAVCAFGLFLTTLSIFCGNQFVTALATTITGILDVESLALAAGFFSVTATFIFHDHKETFAGWQATLLPATNTRQQAADRLPSDIPANDTGQNQVALSELTERENEVLTLLLKGRSGRFISETLNISANTVKFHTRNIYNKLSVNNRQQLLSLFENEN